MPVLPDDGSMSTDPLSADGELDAVVLARAGLARLGRVDEVTETINSGGHRRAHPLHEPYVLMGDGSFGGRSSRANGGSSENQGGAEQEQAFHGCV